MNEATQRQIEAATPTRSTWLSANAGSGKTRVLTDRVARLLLGGTSPQNILCLTYTKAAASEMQNRLFETLGKWAMLPEDDLRATLETLTGGERITSNKLSGARRLFAKSVETPGGLRIQTIHSFCAILLRRFPVEAVVSPQFTEMDDRSAELLRDDCLEVMAERHPDLLLNMARVLGGGDMRPLISALVGERDAFRTPLDEAKLRELLELPPGLSMDDLLAEVFHDNVSDLLDRVATVMTVSEKATDHGHAIILTDAKDATTSSLEALTGVFLLKSGANEGRAKIGKVPTKNARNALDPADADALDALMERVEAARNTQLALTELHRNLTLQRFAAAYLPIYEQAKADRGWLDFDDLILKARDLLTDPKVAQWVLYRLDGGIDHILVDEAQDTSPAQWQMIEALAQEVASGHGTRAVGERTIFVVGDKKQSIYSFQGADPEGFDRMYDRFADRLESQDLQRLDMLYSFRSSAAILNAVDVTFANQDMAHIAFHDALPGRVDLWPLIETEKTDEPGDFDDPVDLVSPADAIVQLAKRIARQVSGMVGREILPDTKVPGDGRWLHAGDVLILFRTRGPLFEATIRACKAAGIPMAGADRLTLTRELAVKDIVAVLSFLATPEDSLSLASALKSPLFGWTEQDLFTLAAHRTEHHLWEALRGQSSSYPAAMAVLNDLRDQAGYLRPFELIERILTRHGGRARLVGRLGPECEEAIDALLSQALTYERTDIPSLTGFLTWLAGDEVQIKRQSEARGRNLRIMTIHGAKGLEAPVVILPDTMGKPPEIKSMLWPVANEKRLLRQSKGQLPAVLQTARAEMEAKQSAERDRLLYVAMTRAQFWLIVAGAGASKETDKRWYGKVEAAMTQLDCVSLTAPEGARRYQVKDWDALATPCKPALDASDETVPLPDWIDRDAARREDTQTFLNPSSLGGAKALPGETMLYIDSDDDALVRGSDLHALLEHLPPDRPDEWDRAALRLLPDMDNDTRSARLDEARTVLTDEGLRELFVSSALVEVAIVAPHPSGRSIVGAIDRLIVNADRVLAVDYKSNRLVPDRANDVPDGLLRQMGAYDAALQQIYPGKRIETALLWTATATLMPLPPDLVRRAFAGVDDLDAPTGPA